MTTFRRRGFYRTSKNGVEHWVSGAEVTRYDWWHSAGNYSGSAASRLSALGAREKLASTYVNPNAKCPVCGDPVFFYQNQFGSKVYFDDLGPPWPKHACTDNSDYYKRSGRAAQIIEPAIRDLDEISTIQSLHKQSFTDLQSSFVAKYKSKPWAPYRVEWCERRGSEHLLVLHGLSEGSAPRLFLKASGFNRRAPVGSLVYYSRNRLSYFAPRRAKAVEIAASRVHGARNFVETLLEFSGNNARRT